ncbi:4Fe-4S dicluster domain-containing protein [Mixta intestinalis]|uniref:Hydrogenase-4 component A n=1 Tax=Mixta intestinalis TaxID=1615494 RepID=A0A6P1Q7S3_9GAMM|nr:4Fe-4S dicluster domain-containing protein [Mixta intestinalis]QHM73845.1 Hydrogenase-4 component A [Mixta intestinalis]
MNEFILADANMCIGCRTCEIACSLAHSSQATLDHANFYPRLVVNKLSEVSVPVMCHQCDNAPCVSACPTAALTRGKRAVEADSSRCIGCLSCMVACPFGVITIESPPETQGFSIIKCDLCATREAGPACVEVCPTFALKKTLPGKLDELKTQRREATAFQRPAGKR